jgi:hypothetical protein
MNVEARWPTPEELLKRMQDRRSYLMRRGDLLGEIVILDRVIAQLTAYIAEGARVQ